MSNAEAVQALLQLGADPEAGSHNQTAMSAALTYAGYTERDARGAVLPLLVQAGADCLRPAASDSPVSLLQSAYYRLAAYLLPPLDQRRAAGRLQLGSKQHAMQLLLATTMHGHAQLAQHAIAALEGLLVEEGAGEEDAEMLQTALAQTFSIVPGVDVPPADRAATLRALLSSSLPLDVAAGPSSTYWMATAAYKPWGAAMVPLLHAAGVPVTLAALLPAVKALSVECTEALLACDRPAADASQPTLTVRYGERSWEETETWSDPIHTLLLHSEVSGLPLLGGPARALPMF